MSSSSDSFSSAPDYDNDLRLTAEDIRLAQQLHLFAQSNPRQVNNA